MTSHEGTAAHKGSSHTFLGMGARITQDEFLKRARQRFGDQFDYSQIIWRSFKSPVKIHCTHHPVQEITITPEKRLQTLGGCRHCLRERRIVALERELNRRSAPERVLAVQSEQSDSVQSEAQALKLTR